MPVKSRILVKSNTLVLKDKSVLPQNAAFLIIFWIHNASVNVKKVMLRNGKVIVRKEK